MRPTADTVLIVEDDLPMRRFLRSPLSFHGFRVIEATTLREAARIIKSARPDVILLDLGLPDGDGMTLLRSLRESSATPVIVVSARDRETDKVVALDAGADDYLTKPFGMSELLARIRVALRHARGGGDPEEPVIIVGPIHIDTARHEVRLHRKLVHLTPIEFRLLALLAQHANNVLTHRQLLHGVWGAHSVEQSHLLRVHIAALRRKIEATPARPRWLTTEVGVGYRLRER